MFEFFLLLLCFSLSNTLHVTKIDTEVIVFDTLLVKGETLQLQGFKNIRKEMVEHIYLKNCSGVIDGVTFRHFPKLAKLTIWTSNIEEINSNLPISHLVVIGSHFPALNDDLRRKLPNLQAIIILGNKSYHVDSLILKNFKKLQALHISEANFSENCITKEWFKQMDSLQELGLSGNDIDCISEDAFSSLRSLRKLDLTYNHIFNLEKKTFKNLTKLEKLGIYENNIASFEVSLLGGQKNHLEQLGISWNVLKYISADNFMKAFPKIKFVSFGQKEMPRDFKAGQFCQALRQNGINCVIDSEFGISKLLGF